MNKKWPDNLIEDIFCIIDDEEKKKAFWKEYGEVTEDKVAGVEYALSQLRERSRTAIYARYYFLASYSECGRLLNISQQSARVAVQNAIKDIRHDNELKLYIQQGKRAKEEVMKLREKRAEEFRIARQNGFLKSRSSKDRSDVIKALPLESVWDLSPLMQKALKDLGYNTIGDFVSHYEDYLSWEEARKKVPNIAQTAKYVMERTGLVKDYSLLDTGENKGE